MRRHNRKASLLRKLSRWTAIAVLAVLFVTCLPVVALRWVEPPTSSFMLQDDNVTGRLSYEWVDWSSINASLPLAVIAAEDQKFPTHFGFDLESIQDSFDRGRNGQGLRGASTITQQVAKNLFLWSGRSFVRKGIEAYVTLLIETAWPKKRILEIYLNIAEFGPGIYGVGAASQEFFGKLPTEIRDSEAALLASVLPNPSRLLATSPSEYVRQRQTWILRQMRDLRRQQLLSLLE